MGPGRFGWDGLIVVVVFLFGGWLHADFAVEARVVEPVDVRQGGPFDVVGAFPWSVVVDEFGLVGAVEAFGEGIVVGVAVAADGAVDAGFGESFGVADGEKLDASIAVMNQTAGLVDASRVDCHLQRIESQVATQ